MREETMEHQYIIAQHDEDRHTVLEALLMDY